MTLLTSSVLFLNPVYGQTSDKWYSNRVVVGLSNSTYANAQYLSSKYGVPIVMTVDEFRFAVFRAPSANIASSFLKSVKQETVVKYAEMDALVCLELVTCGGGGGGTSPPGDFYLSASPYSLTMGQGASATSTITVLGVNAFAGTVGLVASVSPVVTNGPSASLSPAAVTLGSQGNTATSVLTITTTTTPLGSYTVTVTGASRGLSHSLNVYVNVPTPNDPQYGNQWGPPDLNLPQAWQRTLGSRNRVVAILDSGIWFGHPDLQANLWTNPVDGSHGWNCIANPQSNNAADDFGHGTMVAGVVAAATNNAIGIAGAVQD